MGWLLTGATVLGGHELGLDGAGHPIMFLLLLGVTFLLGRALAYAVARHLRRTGVVAHRTLIVGATEHGRRLGEVLADRPEYGLRPVGFVVEDHVAPDDLSLPVVGHLADLLRTIEEQHAAVAVLAYERMSDTDLVPLVRSCHRLSCELFLIPHFAELHSVNEDTELVWGVPMVRLRRAAHRTLSWRFKRVMDAGVAGLAIALLAPVLAALALAVRLEGGPGVIFRQVRVGIDGREFSLLKFRSMRPVDEDESATQWNIARDDRVGPVGRFIRTTSLDELPQLVNILRGDMSLVGPRPERPHFVEQFSRRYPQLRLPRPGALRPHGLGPDPRPARGHRDRRTGGLRQLLHRELVALARPQDHAADAGLRRQGTGRLTLGPRAAASQGACADPVKAVRGRADAELTQPGPSQQRTGDHSQSQREDAPADHAEGDVGHKHESSIAYAPGPAHWLFGSGS